MTLGDILSAQKDSDLKADSLVGIRQKDRRRVEKFLTCLREIKIPTIIGGHNIFLNQGIVGPA